MTAEEYADACDKVIDVLKEKIANLEAQIREKEYQEENYLNKIDHKEEVIKTLQAQIEKMQNCKNCKKEKIEGACGHFTQVGWCKNWEMTK